MTTKQQEPVDRFRMVWLIFFTLGLGTLLPWNFFMTAITYFKFQLQDVNVTMERSGLNGTEGVIQENYLQGMFGNMMTLCAMLPLLVFSCLNSILLQRIPEVVRICGCLAAIFILFLFTSILVKVSLEPIVFFAVTMLTIFLINSFGAVLQGSIFGLAGLLPALYTAPIMSGQGMAGTFAAVAMICAIASGSSPTESAFGYFNTACVVILLAILAYLALPHLEFSRYYFSKGKTEWKKGLEREEERVCKMDLIKQDPSHVSERRASAQLMESASTETPRNVSVFTILRKIWPMALMVCLVFTVTIGVFPAVTVDVKSNISADGTWGTYFIPICCFLLFNVFDWIGRSLTAVCMWPRKDSKFLPVLVLARIIFIPVFMLCNVHPRRMPVFFTHDAWYIVFMMFFAFSNGYLASLCMCYGPKNVFATEAETAGAIMAFFLSLGLATGACLSFLFRGLV
ncbi:equilibrative nucleoside transporter 1-like isoform X2 [Hemiscyllium ocellatum]|uniref:equilibrative nucleoside transporter 1-like isoform X2 n=1 Tax=Hemiscyllium ocellatum TaxID=170820 RepID=UPI0029668F19|nr:equilibrative nucleoside transporter 1-like isoform X2 [Hemiscyllium ocellatum]XP_060703730.1 equilibrative nucleoside transporter 1-like isoform X2 [Hemiscyllium ocellatum]XP_060703738.1 equilibrative nucleoside transporter 1-like isoform X2 [Hemiscyllium ocellatum]XP_060703745.1 equilibrative nucleoside transporter 1-like isoform X2 [Hemiscyllium ocellatum]XP_060703752.1 equilibrative nucleoside transporter 1-like isoform X2 [Hemiscyllium ocellatum]XP_060703761.1 equilibrative nucleoside 